MILTILKTTFLSLLVSTSVLATPFEPKNITSANINDAFDYQFNNVAKDTITKIKNNDHSFHYDPYLYSNLEFVTSVMKTYCLGCSFIKKGTIDYPIYDLYQKIWLVLK